MLEQCALVFVGVMLGMGVIGSIGVLIVEVAKLEEDRRIRHLRRRRK